MNCSETRALLSDLIDDELADDTRAAVEAHLTVCARCRASHRALRRTVHFVRANAATTMRRGTPGGAHEELTRAMVDESYGRTPEDVIVRSIRAMAPELLEGLPHALRDSEEA